MISLNWFETRISTDLLQFPYQDVPEINVEKPKKPYRLYLDCANRRRYHLTTTPTQELKIVEISPYEQPHLVSLLLEESLRQSALAKGFSVRKRIRGWTCLKDINDLVLPSVLSFMEGISFRGYFFKNDGIIRWGMVLSYATSQRFLISLEDNTLAEQAIGRIVIRINHSHFDDEEDDTGILEDRRFRLVQVSGQKAQIIKHDGSIILEKRSDWTIPCNKSNLKRYIFARYGPSEADEVSRKLQRLDLTTTAEGRINTCLAKDQIEKVREIVKEHSLDEIRLCIPGNRVAVLDLRPLVIGGTD